MSCDPNAYRDVALVVVLALCFACSSSEDGTMSEGEGSQGAGAGSTSTGGDPDDPPPIDEEALDSWCDASTWGGGVPTESTDVIIEPGQVVLVDCDATARTIEIQAGGMLVGSRAKSSMLTLHGNLVVRGRLDYGTPSDRVRLESHAEIVFSGMNDDDYQGAGPPEEAVDIEVMDSDVGLWVVDAGVLSAAGQEKKSWSRLADGAGPGDPTFTVDDGSGWLAGDKIMLTPTAMTSAPDYAEQFDEGAIASVDGFAVALAAAPAFEHAGCTGCMRRGEAANLSRNVTIRSLDDSAHAHIMVTDDALAKLDSVELRWLGPEKPGGPMRRSALYFGRQREASSESYVRHSAIWGGQHGFIQIEASDGIELTDLVGYDTAADGVRGGFSLFDEARSAPKDVLFTEVLAARIISTMREGDGARIQYNVHGIACGGGPGTGCRRCVATGIVSENSAGYFWNNNIHLPAGPDQVFEDNVSHNQGYNGIRLWQNSETATLPWSNTQIWSTLEGLFEGAYGNPYQFGNVVIEDSILHDAVLQAVPLAENQSQLITRMNGATLGSISISGYVIIQFNDQVFENVTFDGTRPIAVTQDHSPCMDGDAPGNENDPDDHVCIRNWARFENCHFPDGVLPFDFGWQANKYATWQVRGFDSADPTYSGLPEDFDLYRKDNQVAGGSYYAPFDAWLVPQ